MYCEFGILFRFFFITKEGQHITVEEQLKRGHFYSTFAVEDIFCSPFKDAPGDYKITKVELVFSAKERLEVQFRCEEVDPIPLIKSERN